MKQTAQEVVKDMEPPQRRQPHPPEGIAQKLPVAASPALHALQIRVRRGREALEQRKVSGKAAVRQQTLDHVVAEHGIVVKRALGAFEKCAHIVNALAAEQPLAAQVAEYVRRAHMVRIRAQVLKAVSETVRRQLHARLNHGVAAAVRARAVQRMVNRADQLFDGARNRLRVRVHGEHIAVAPRQRRGARPLGSKPVFPRRKQRVQVAQSAALALAPHPDAVRLIIFAHAVQEEILLAPGARVHPRDFRAHAVENLRILFGLRLLPVPEIAQQQKIDALI